MPQSGATLSLISIEIDLPYVDIYVILNVFANKLDY